MEKLLTPENLCELLGIKTSTLYAWTSRNLIPYLKVNGLLRFREREIEEWLKSKERRDNISHTVEKVLNRQNNGQTR
ncbi:MAG: helix-turn-helix domain-containing protein [Deltaproteobacteria bacterium]|nr:helix-turn-helix domain-containing protein [Deltaproteobacteria bacterium]